MHVRDRSDLQGDHAGQCQQADTKYVGTPCALRPMVRPSCVRRVGFGDNTAALVGALVSALRPRQIAALGE
jgi:hypothetical protein